ncbi:LPXTG cell wall anchor domain-containing protein [Amycolatopsis sp. WAC 04197]|nr:MULTISPECIES: MYXO-CTERM sorting domain-containing protein [Amycolatopsis]RSN38555.1 LPXTG cell wall anchor domain-containing protein [Amycolatopsis sp. WAC 04197]
MTTEMWLALVNDTIGNAIGGVLGALVAAWLFRRRR